MSSVIKQLGAARVVPVVVVDDADQGLGVARALVEGGLPVAEVTFRTAGAREAVAAIARQVPEILLGAGTVLTADQVDQAADAGARFLVSPGLSTAVVERARHHGLPLLPGVATPSEIMAALDLGLDHLKLFPAGVVGGPAAIKAFAAPFTTARFIPTGGVSAANLADYLAVPAVHAAGGSWMVEAALARAGDFDEITTRTRAAVALAQEARP